MYYVYSFFNLCIEIRVARMQIGFCRSFPKHAESNACSRLYKACATAPDKAIKMKVNDAIVIQQKEDQHVWK
jgi:hypothetical protein